MVSQVVAVLDKSLTPVLKDMILTVAPGTEIETELLQANFRLDKVCLDQNAV